MADPNTTILTISMALLGTAALVKIAYVFVQTLLYVLECEE